MNAPPPGSPEWVSVVTASKTAAILGVSPWHSPRSIWHAMRGEIPHDDGKNAQAKGRGHYLEGGILAWWRDRHPDHTDWQEQVWCTRPDVPWGAATPDGKATTPGGVVLVDAKSTSNLDEWGDPGTDQIPTHYLVSSYWQLAMCPEAQRVYVAVLGPFLRFEEYVVERDAAVEADLIARCKAFYDSLTADTPPPLDDHVATFETLRQQRGRIEKKATAYIAPDLAAQWVDARAAEDEAVSAARLWDSRLLEAAGNAQYLHTDSGRFARQQDNRNRPIPLKTSLAQEPAA